MTTPAEAAKNTVEIAKRHIPDQQLRIARQRDLIAELERDGHPDVVAKARQMLGEMEEMLAQMEADYPRKGRKRRPDVAQARSPVGLIGSQTKLASA
jgi:hypothetical protein